MTFRIGVDIGGTFTDFALIDDRRGAVTVHKQLTTPRDPSLAVLDGVVRLVDKIGIAVADVAALIHGSTLVANAVIERKGAVTGMLVTRGFRDVLDIAMERRYDVYDLKIKFPAPIVPRRRRAEIGERVRFDGTIARALDLEELRVAVRSLIAGHGIDALAVCFLHSFTNRVHEDAACALIRSEFPDLYVSGSAELFPFMREYERWTTATVNAYTQPMVDTYLGNLESGLGGLGFAGQFLIMSSSGGTITPETARRFPVRMLESGPAAGALMSAYHGRRLEIANILSFDMGGTTAKGAVVHDGAPQKRYEMEVAREHEFKAGSGLPVKIPVLDMIEIGAGGGSIAEVDERGLIRVGPRSAGADPGPACYGRGGGHATLTDANLALGYLDPGFFLGGEMKLDWEAAALALRSGIGATLGLDAIEAAWGIHEVINEDVARAFRVHASERGFDYRKCSMIAFGGSGPAHALRIARKLRIPRVVFPAGAGVMSAIGMLVSPLSFEVARTLHVVLKELTPERFARQFAGLDAEARDFLVRAGVEPSTIRMSRRLDMRYEGQGYEIEVRLPDAADAASLHADLPTLFVRSYAEIFSTSLIDEPVEIVNWKAEAIGPEPETSEGFRLAGPEAAPRARKGTRRAYFPNAGGMVDCPVYDRYALVADMRIEGPALVEERESTSVVGVGDTMRVDRWGNLVAEISFARASS